MTAFFVLISRNICSKIEKLTIISFSFSLSNCSVVGQSVYSQAFLLRSHEIPSQGLKHFGEKVHIYLG